MKENFLSHSELKFWIPIGVSIATATAAVGTFLATTNIKLDQIAQNQQKIENMWIKLEARVGNIELKEVATNSFHEEISRILNIR